MQTEFIEILTSLKHILYNIYRIYNKKLYIAIYTNGNFLLMTNPSIDYSRKRYYSKHILFLNRAWFKNASHDRSYFRGDIKNRLNDFFYIFNADDDFSLDWIPSSNDNINSTFTSTVKKAKLSDIYLLYNESKKLLLDIFNTIKNDKDFDMNEFLNNTNSRILRQMVKFHI